MVPRRLLTIEEKPDAQRAEFSAILWMLDSFSCNTAHFC
jgi:hypothetical protein